MLRKVCNFCGKAFFIKVSGFSLDCCLLKVKDFAQRGDMYSPNAPQSLQLCGKTVFIKVSDFSLDCCLLKVKDFAQQGDDFVIIVCQF